MAATERRAVVVALCLLGALATAWFVMTGDDEGDRSGGERFVVATVTVEVDGTTLTLRGAVPSEEDRQRLVDSLTDRDDVVAVIDRLVVDPAAPPPTLGAFHTGLDVHRRSAG